MAASITTIFVLIMIERFVVIYYFANLMQMSFQISNKNLCYYCSC